jgi:hypothetical protein
LIPKCDRPGEVRVFVADTVYGFVLNIILEIKLQPDDTYGNMQLPWQQGKLQSNGNVFSPLKFHIFIIFSSFAWPFNSKSHPLTPHLVHMPLHCLLISRDFRRILPNIKYNFLS